MNVLQIIPSMNPHAGGTSQGIRNMIPELQRLGVQNEVVCLDGPSDDFLGKDPFKIIALGPAKGPWQYNSKLVPWLMDNIGRFDVIIVNALWLYHGYAFKKALHQYKKLLVSKGAPLKYPVYYVMPHGMLDPYFQQAPERKIKAIRNWVYWKLIESKLVNDSDGLLFTCKTELLLARKPFRPYHPQKELNIGYGVEPPPPFEPNMPKAFFEKCPQVEAQPFILFLSRIHEKKGVGYLIEAYLKLLNKPEQDNNLIGGSPPFPKLVIAGPGLETDYGKKMLQLVASSKKLQGSIFFPGMLSGNAKWGAFYGAEAFILPSHQENFGIAVVEALACQKPVLISKQVNIWPEIIEGGGGMVADDTTEGTLQLLTGWKKLSVEEKGKMGANARIVYEDNFKIESSAKKLLQVINGA